MVAASSKNVAKNVARRAKQWLKLIVAVVVVCRSGSSGSGSAGTLVPLVASTSTSVAM